MRRCLSLVLVLAFSSLSHGSYTTLYDDEMLYAFEPVFGWEAWQNLGVSPPINLRLCPPETKELVLSAPPEAEQPKAPASPPDPAPNKVTSPYLCSPLPEVKPKPTITLLTPAPPENKVLYSSTMNAKTYANAPARHKHIPKDPPPTQPIRHKASAPKPRASPYCIPQEPLTTSDAKELFEQASLSFEAGDMEEARKSFLLCYRKNSINRWSACLGIAHVYAVLGNSYEASMYINRIELGKTCPNDLKERSRRLCNILANSSSMNKVILSDFPCKNK